MKILVRAPNWLGDLVMSLGFFRRLHDYFPEAEIDVIVKDAISELVSLFPGIMHVYPYSKRGLLGIYRFTKRLPGGYDFFFCLPNSFSSAFMGMWIDSKKKIGYKKEGRGIFFTKGYKHKKPSGLHRVEEYGFLLSGIADCREFSVFLNASFEEPEVLKTIKDRLIVVLNINSHVPSKRLPTQKGAKIANLLIKGSNCTIVLIGTDAEKGYVNSLLSQIENQGNIVNFCGKTTLLKLASILKWADLVISTDSGPAHLANSLMTPVIVLMGLGDEHNTGPYNRENLLLIRKSNLECAPCRSNTCKFQIPKCLEEIDEEEIIEKATLILHNRVNP